MEMQTPKLLRQRKLLLLLPAVIVPLMTLLFLSLGGGQADAAGQTRTSKAGLNTKLPDAKLKDEHALTKMAYYDQAASDSRKLKEQMKSDPYSHGRNEMDSAGLHFPRRESTPRSYGSGGPKPDNDPAKSAALVSQQLAQLQATLDKPHKEPRPPVVRQEELSISPRLQEVKAQQSTSGEDPELRQMNVLLEKILDIQHPERLAGQPDAPAPAENKKFKAIPAVIDGNQKITQGTVVRLKLLDTLTLNGQLIPKGQLVFASGNLYNQRLTLNIRNIRVGYTILPVDLTVFDMTDGLEGVNVPEAVTGDALKDGASGGVQGVEFMSLDPSLTTQLAGAGLNTAKGLFSKKVRRIKAKLKDGHQLLIRNNKNANTLK